MRIQLSTVISHNCMLVFNSREKIDCTFMKHKQKKYMTKKLWFSISIESTIRSILYSTKSNQLHSFVFTVVTSCRTTLTTICCGRSILHTLHAGPLFKVFGKNRIFQGKYVCFYYMLNSFLGPIFVDTAPTSPVGYGPACITVIWFASLE